MGLDTSHSCWHGAYSAFMTWREKLAEVAELPPLELMDNFCSADSTYGLLPLLRSILDTAPGLKDILDWRLTRLWDQLPISWECLKPDVLYILLSHSDYDGEINAEDCGPLADRLAELIPLLPDEDVAGHIGNWRTKTQVFVDGLRRAAAAGEPVDFH
jgi:hypothetical protein